MQTCGIVSVTTAQKHSASEELLTAVRLVSSGLGQLRLLDDGASDFYHLPVLALQTGLERWFKISICYLHLEQHRVFPPATRFPRSRKGHDIFPLVKDIAVSAYTPELEARLPDLKLDREFLSSPSLRRCISTLSLFGQFSRYYHLDMVLAQAPTYATAEMDWDDLVTATLKDDPDLEQRFWDANRNSDALREAQQKTRANIARCGRALARLLAWGALGDEAVRHGGYVDRFLRLGDGELATAQFTPFTLEP